MHRISQQGCIKKEKEEKYDTSCTSTGRDDQITTSAKLLDIKYKSYGYLIETIKNLTRLQE